VQREANRSFVSVVEVKKKNRHQPVTLIYFFDVVELKLFNYGDLLNVSGKSIL
jgi:hypothetical protein